MLLAVRSTSSAAASENATRELVGSAMSNPSELVHGRDMAPPYSCCYWPHGQGAPEGKAPQTAGSLPCGRRAAVEKDDYRQSLPRPGLGPYATQYRHVMAALAGYPD